MDSQNKPSVGVTQRMVFKEMKTEGLIQHCLKWMALCIVWVAILVLLSSCASLENKAVGAAGTVSAIKIESAGGSTTGTPLPNVLLGGAAFAFADSPDSGRPVYARAARSSIISKLFGLGMDDEAVVYIGVHNESAAETASRLKAFGIDSPRRD